MQKGTGQGKMNRKTHHQKKEDVSRKWYVIDASEKVLGRLAARVAKLLQGKHKANFSPHVDCGDFVVVKNASKVRLTGKKLQAKFEFRHSGYFSGDKYIPYEKLIKSKPERILFLAVQGMLPKNKLRARYLKHLKIYAGAEHPHGAQQPADMAV